MEPSREELLRQLAAALETNGQLRALCEAQAQKLEAQAQKLEAQAQKITEQAALIEELQEKLQQNSSNSSNPPSSDSPNQREKNRQKRKRKESRRKRGGQPGHKGHSRKLVPLEDVDKVEPHFPKVCENCWATLPEVEGEDPTRHQVIELTGKGGVIITEHQCHGVKCEACGHVTWADGEEVPCTAFGPRLCATIVMLTGVYHLSRRQTKKMLFEVFGIKISLGSISNIEDRVTPLLQPAYEEAKARADEARIKHTDGTSWRQAGTAMQLWTVATAAVTVFTIVTDGSSRTLQGLFGRIKGILISDRAKAINFWAMKRRQICWAHLLRKFISFSERDGPAGKLGTELVDYTCVIFKNYQSFTEGKISRRVFRERLAPVRPLFEALLQRAVEADIKRMSGSCRDILEHKEALWTFVDHNDVEPTNNHAERELRAFVLWRKKSFGTQSDRGNRFAERIMTVVHSLRKQRCPVLPCLTALTSAAA